MNRLVLFGAAAVGALALIACGDDDNPGGDAAEAKPGDVTVALTNWAVTPSMSTVPAGTVRFIATHPEEHSGHGSGEAGQVHQLIVAPLAGGESGKSAFGSPVLNLSDIKVGESKSGEVTLEAGEYELACLVAETVDGKTVNHYEQGMHRKLVVQLGAEPPGEVNIMGTQTSWWHRTMNDEAGAALPAYAIAAVAVLGIAVAGLALALGIVLARDSDDSATMRPGMNGYAGMMGAMAMMDTDTMLERMREVLGDEGYQEMLDHMQAHRNGTAGDTVPGVDGMMHRLMDGMMSMMPADSDGHMFPNRQMPMQGMPGMTPGTMR